MAGSVTEAQSHDEGRGKSVTGKRTNCNGGHGNTISKHGSVTEAWLPG